MRTFALIVGPVPIDLSAAVSDAVLAVSRESTGRFRLANTDDNSSVYIAVQKTSPAGTVPGVAVPVGGWFPEALDFQPLAVGPVVGVRVWAWAAHADTKIMVLWT